MDFRISSPPSSSSGLTLGHPLSLGVEETWSALGEKIENSDATAYITLPKIPLQRENGGAYARTGKTSTHTHGMGTARGMDS
jgi:hypothetical protein